MSLSQAISAALSGLRTTQAGMGLLADNVANAETPGYVRKSLLQATTASSGGAAGVRVVGVNRELDLFVQRQLRSELAGAGYVNTVVDFRVRMDQIYGQPGGANSLDTLFNRFVNSLGDLTTSPESISARGQVLNEARVLAQHLNAMSHDIQALRSEAEVGIAAAVERVNQILQNVEQISNRIISAGTQGVELAALLDARDTLLAELSQLIDVRVVNLERNQIAIFTNSGVSLFDHKASRLRFDGRDALNAHSLWSANPNERGVGTIKLTTASGYEFDLLADRVIRSGTIAALIEMRDQVLVQAQAQLDEVAHALALSLSNRSVAGVGVTAGAQTGFDLDVSALLAGNAIHLTYTDGAGTHRVTIVRVDDPSSLPLDDSITPDSTDTVIGVDFSGGLAGVVATLNAALGPAGLSFSNPSGSTLRVLDDGAPDLVDVDAFEANVTTATLDSGHLALPFFVDGGTGAFYTNAIAGNSSQKRGFAERIMVNGGLVSDPARLVLYSSSALAGDPARPNHLEQQLTGLVQLFAPATGLGSKSTPFSGTLVDFLQQTITMQGAAVENAQRLKEGQDIVVNALQSRFAERSSVNIDGEMANLLTLQTAYAANARVLTAVKEMIDALLAL